MTTDDGSLIMSTRTVAYGTRTGYRGCTGGFFSNVLLGLQFDGRAANFAAIGSIRTQDPLGIHSRVNGDCAKRTLNSSEERKTEEAYSLSSIKASTIVLDLAS